MPVASVAWSYSVSLDTSLPAVPPVAFSAAPTPLTTFNALPYFKKDAAFKKCFAVSASMGAPNFSASSFSEPTVTTSCAGPQTNAPANPPMLVDTAGTTFVASISLT